MADFIGAFPSSLALDDRNNVVREAEAHVYDVNDTNLASPLPITDLQGVPFTGGKLVASNGIFPQFRAPVGVLQVYVKSGDRVTQITDLSVYADASRDSASRAEGAASEAATSRAGAVQAATDAGIARTGAEAAAARAEAVGATTDDITEGLIKTPGTKTEAALSRTIVELAGGASVNEKAIDRALAVLDMRIPETFVAAIASDSTADGTNEWYELAWRALFESLWPDRPARVVRWNKANGAYIEPIIWQTAETPAVPPSGETSTPNQIIGQDGFDSPAPIELNGRAAGVGAAGATWTATPGAFKVASGVIYSTATSGSGFNCYFSLASRSGIDLHTEAMIRFNSTPSAATRSVGLYGPYITSQNNITLQISRATTGVVVCTLRKNIGGVATTIATFPAGTIPENVTAAYAASITVTATGSTATVSATLNGQTVTGNLTEAEVTALTGATRGGFVANVANDPDFQFSSYEARGTVVTPANPGSPAVPSPLPYATIYNSSAAGESAAYQQARIDAMYPVRPDVLLIAHGHNYGASTPQAFLAGIDAFVEALLTKWPGVPVVAVSQNPEYAGANVAAHAARQAALRTHALGRGWVYVPAFEAFSQRADGGKSMVSADGIHPVTLGQALWRDTAITAVQSRSARRIDA